jgi:hypothetical protein
MHPVHGENSFQLTTPELDLSVTARAGHMAPVVFHLPGRDVSPYALAPWQPAEFPDMPPLISVLRGDFLCLPFGGQTNGPPHGDPANAEWSLVSQNERSITLRQHASDSGASIEKIISTRAGHHAVYAEHRISNLDGEYNYGTHPVLDLTTSAGRVSVSPFRYASVFPGFFSDPANDETQALKPGAEFTDLTSVPLAAGGATDLTRYPARPGNDDLVMMVSAPATPDQPFAWSAAVLEGYVWFALKKPSDFPATLLWMSNGGRSAAPWNKRHIGRLGIEEVCSYFSHGVDESRKSPLAHLGIPTVRSFHSDETVSLRMIQAVAAVSANFGKVASIRPGGENSIVITGESGEEITAPVEWGFVLSQSTSNPNPSSPP